MNNDLSNYRKNYQKGTLHTQNVPITPIELFQEWFFEAENNKTSLETNAMNLASIGLDGFPKNRIVLLKQFTAEGFVFYTNYNSEKGKAMVHNPNVCASFFWEEQERQVIVKGTVEKTATTLSDKYFNTRPKGSKIGAWASPQSEVVASKEKLEQQMEQYASLFKDQPIPRPTHWGGYIIKPVSIEFWQGRPNRMHDRIRYTLFKKNEWKIQRLAP